MRLLIVTQKVDRRDPTLGFFHRWLEEFAAHCESVAVIGQCVGDHQLPANVSVHSLGKECGAWRITQILRYKLLLWRLRRKYDAIFVHMTPVWVILAWKDAFLLRKRLYLWYEARGTRWTLKLALRLVTKVFSASRAGMPITTPKSVITGHGIDTEQFHPADSRDAHLLLTVGRITAAKRLQIILGAFHQLPSEYRLLIAGGTITPDDEGMRMALQAVIEQWGIRDRVTITPLSHERIARELGRAALFLHASETSLDKALLEAMASGCLVVSCAQAAHGVLPPECRATPAGMADRAKTLLGLPASQQEDVRKGLRNTVIRDHGLTRLVERLIREMNSQE